VQVVRRVGSTGGLVPNSSLAPTTWPPRIRAPAIQIVIVPEPLKAARRRISADIPIRTVRSSRGAGARLYHHAAACRRHRATRVGPAL